MDVAMVITLESYLSTGTSPIYCHRVCCDNRYGHAATRPRLRPRLRRPGLLCARMRITGFMIICNALEETQLSSTFAAGHYTVFRVRVAVTGISRSIIVNLWGLINLCLFVWLYYTGANISKMPVKSNMQSKKGNISDLKKELEMVSQPSISIYFMPFFVRVG